MGRPACFPSAWAVGATGSSDRLSSFSSIVPQTPLANLGEGYKAALETEAALTGGIGPVSPLAAPMAHYLVEKAGSLDDGEFSALRNRYSGDIQVKDLLNQMFFDVFLPSFAGHVPLLATQYPRAHKC
ncbi:MAG: hypothetical protein HQM09_14505 [Candidatus Riflebacteria bacterium]|nr:hypothetical protein [Candidatus Riflebacteria bacterium]